MKILIPFLLFSFSFLVFLTPPVLAQDEPPSDEPPPEEITPSPPPCGCDPGSTSQEEKVDCDFDGQVPGSWCCKIGDMENSAECPSNRQADWGRGVRYLYTYTYNCDCSFSTDKQKIREECTNSCQRAKPQITPIHYSAEKSVGNYNEYLEKGVHSGTRRDVGINPSDINNYGAVAGMIPAGGPNHELRVEFVRGRGNYEVVLADGTKQEALDIWNECTGFGDLNNWQAYFDQLNDCQIWGFVPTTYRRLESEPTPVVQARKAYFEEEQSPFVMAWDIFVPFRWLGDLFRNWTCTWFFGLGCDSGLPLRNPETAPGWTKDEPNIPREAIGNARLVRQIFFPSIPPGPLPTVGDTYTYYKLADPQTRQTLGEIGEAGQYAAVEGGQLRMFQPRDITPEPKACQENVFSPREGCPSDYYFKMTNVSTGECLGDLCWTDTPDHQTFNSERFQDARPEILKNWTDFFKQGLCPQGLDCNP